MPVRTHILVLALLLPVSLFAQNSLFNGLWVAPITKGTGPGFLAFGFSVNGDTVTGTVSDKGGPAQSFTDGKIDNGKISFSFAGEGRSFTGTLKDAKRLDLVQELRLTDHKLIRKPGTKGPPNSPEGEWIEEGRPGAEDTIPVYVLHANGDKLTGEVHDHQTHDGVIGAAVILPLTEGTVHGNEVSFRFNNKWRAPMFWTGKLVGDRLVVTTDVKSNLRAVRLAESGTGAAVAGGPAGLWVAPTTKGTGAAFLAFTFNVNGSTLSGSVSDKGGPPQRFKDGKAENGRISFALPKEQLAVAALDMSYLGTQKDPKHLDLIQTVHFTGYKVVRKPGTTGPPDSLEGEWVLAGGPPGQEANQIFTFHVQGDKLTGQFLEHEVYDGVVGRAVIDPLTDGQIHGNQVSFGYINKMHNPSLWTGTFHGDHLVMDSDLKNRMRAVRLADASGAGAAPETVGMDGGKMGPYRALARLAMEAVKRNDLAAAQTLCQVLERLWDRAEQDLQKSSPSAWEQIDKAMDVFIRPIMGSEGASPNPAALDAGYRDYLKKLKLVD